jgi:hypothetical protein
MSINPGFGWTEPFKSVIDNNVLKSYAGAGGVLWVVRRNTRQRRAIEEVFQSANRPLSTQEVLDLAQSQKPGIGIATVYRTLKMLIDTGWLTVVKLPGEPPRYEIAGKPHHHHF